MADVGRGIIGLNVAHLTVPVAVDLEDSPIVRPDSVLVVTNGSRSKPALMLGNTERNVCPSAEHSNNLSLHGINSSNYWFLCLGRLRCRQYCRVNPRLLVLNRCSLRQDCGRLYSFGELVSSNSLT